MKRFYTILKILGKEDCSVMQVLRKANVNVKQKEPIVKPDFDFHFPKNYSLHEKDFCKIEDKEFQAEIEYLAKHLRMNSKL